MAIKFNDHFHAMKRVTLPYLYQTFMKYIELYLSPYKYIMAEKQNVFQTLNVA